MKNLHELVELLLISQLRLCQEQCHLYNYTIDREQFEVDDHFPEEFFYKKIFSCLFKYEFDNDRLTSKMLSLNFTVISLDVFAHAPVPVTMAVCKGIFSFSIVGFE